MNKAQPLVSVVMPVYNSERFLRTAIDSVLKQSWKNLELLLVDDASTDRSWEILKSYSDPRVRRYRMPENVGPAATRNRCLDQVCGEYVGFFDSDDIATPDWLEEEVLFLENHPEYQMVGAWTETIDEKGQASGVNGYRGSSEQLGVDMLFVNRLPTSNLVVKRSLIEGKHFDSKIVIASDYEMWVRLMENAAAYILPRVLSKYRVHPDNITHRKQLSTEASMKEIMRRQIHRLGLDPKDAELEIHLQIPRLTIYTSKETVIAAESWLLKLAEGNENKKKYPVSAFREMLAARWYGVCYSACEHGLWTWQRFNQSQLCRIASVGLPKKTMLRYLVSRARLKHAFPQLARCLKKDGC